MHSAEVVYNSRDNHIELELRENGVNLADYSPISRVKMMAAGVALDSDINPEWFDWSELRIVIKAGLAGLVVGTYKARLETWDLDHPNGLVWTESLYMVVKD